LPVDVITPFEVIGVTGSGDTTIEFELLHIPEFDDVRDDDPKPLRATRLLALAEILLLRSSRSNDLRGET
jgi:hypothetical protein